MSISSMLGTEPEKPVYEPYHNHGQPSRTASRQPSGSGPSLSLGAVMSPPQYPTKVGEYSYRPRSNTPDRVAGPGAGTRPHRSRSGSLTQRPGPFYEPPSRTGPNQTSLNTYPEPRYTPLSVPPMSAHHELDERARRTSISGLLQRPESQPQPSTMSASFFPTSNPPSRPESIPPSLGHPDHRSAQPPMTNTDPPRPNSVVGLYDTRPPSLSSFPRPQHGEPTTQTASASAERPHPPSLSPELRRLQLNGHDTRGFAGILNQQIESVSGAPNMMRQDSVQSQSDRSVFGDRLRSRPYSPFAGSVASQSGPLDDQARKGSDELSQHRAILALANESKRGRYSPLPQAVQGAQAHTPTPDAGIKTEHGRVFSGIGSGMGSTSANPTPTPQPLPASPFKRDEGNARLSEENLMKMSRSTSGISKRPRKGLDEDPRAESDVGDVKKSGPGRGKRSKYQHSYKLDLDDSALGPRRHAATPTSNPSQPLLHHSLQRQNSAAGNAPIFKPKQIIRISNVVALARRNPRRHLGFFRYTPDVGPVDLVRPSAPKFDISIQPNLLPSFTDPECINCTYTVRVSRLWLRQRERGLICAERYLWGSGIYSDDSDPLAAAMHSGFITSVYPAGIDEALLSRVIAEQNPRIEGCMAPENPKPVEENKDLHITLVVLPQLERYAESVRFGIKSRNWPDGPDAATTSPTADPASKMPHDGVSFMVLKTEFVDDGVEVKLVGRTGKEKRERLRRELMERKRGFELEKQRLAKAALKAKEKKEELTRNGRKGHGVSSAASMEKSSSHARNSGSRTEGNQPAVGTEQDNATTTADADDKMMELDVGQSPGDWIRQLAVAAA